MSGQDTPSLSDMALLKNKDFWLFKMNRNHFFYRQQLYIIFCNQSLVKIFHYFFAAKYRYLSHVTFLRAGWDLLQLRALKSMHFWVVLPVKSTLKSIWDPPKTPFSESNEYSWGWRHTHVQKKFSPLIIKTTGAICKCPAFPTLLLFHITASSLHGKVYMGQTSMRSVQIS